MYSTLLARTIPLSAGWHQDHGGFPTLFHFLGRRRHTISEGGHLNKAGHEFAPFSQIASGRALVEYSVFDVFNFA